MNTNLKRQMQPKVDTRTSHPEWGIWFPIILLTLAGVALTGCVAPKAPGDNNQPAATAPKYPPNYDTPEGSFVTASFGKLASEFIDEYANKYVVFDCYYMNHHPGAWLLRDPRARHNKDIMSALLSSDASKQLEVLWSVEDRDLGRPFVEIKYGAPLRVYGFVLPANSPWSIKTRQDLYNRGVSIPLVLLIKAVPL